MARHNSFYAEYTHLSVEGVKFSVSMGKNLL